MNKIRHVPKYLFTNNNIRIDFTGHYCFLAFYPTIRISGRKQSFPV